MRLFVQLLILFSEYVSLPSSLSLSHTQAHNEYVPLLLENYIRLDLVDRMILEGNICNVSIS